MLFTIIIGLFFIAVVFFHYIQGFFSATISAILAVFSAVLAFSYHEGLVEKLSQGRAENVAHGMTLVVLFATFYLVLRIIFDKVVPNGVMLPAMVDRVGGAAMGIVAAIFATGTIAIACEELPFGSSVAYYTKYHTENNRAEVPSGGIGQNQSGFCNDELRCQEAGKFDEKDREHTFPMILPGVDEMVVWTVSHLNEVGALQGSQKLSYLHPDFLQEIYGQNIGIQGGAKHVAQNLSGRPKTVSIAGVFVVQNDKGENEDVNLTDGEFQKVRQKSVQTPLQSPADKKYEYTIGKEQTKRKVQHANLASKEMTLAVVRITFGPDASDTDNIIRLSPGSIRLVIGTKNQSGEVEYHNYYPIGMIEPSEPRVYKADQPAGVPPPGVPNFFVDKPDDYLIIKREKAQPAIDAVFAVNREGFQKGQGKDAVVEDRVFIEVKRMCRETLGGMSIARYPGDHVDIKIGTEHQQKLDEYGGVPPP